MEDLDQYRVLYKAKYLNGMPRGLAMPWKAETPITILKRTKE